MTLASSPARADVVDPLIEGAKQCTASLPRYEREYGIPTHLLSAIASTESGRYHEGLKIRIPWPWTINANGKGYFFDTKAQAINAVRRLQAQGIQSIDVGCMQVNLYHHARAFASLEDAFDPAMNEAYAAGFLRGLFQEEGSWKMAAADYHSKTPRLGNEYAGQVYSSWYQIVDKLRAARLQVPESSVVAMNDMKDAVKSDGLHSDAVRPTPVRTIPMKAEPMQVATAQRGLPEQRGKRLAALKTPHMNSIQVSNRQSDNGIIVVRPEITVADGTQEITQAALHMASAIPSGEQPMALPSNNAGVIRLDGQRVIATQPESDQHSGPRFVFND